MNPIEHFVNSVVSTIFAICPQRRPSREDLSHVRLVAHRGVHEDGAQENSFEAFRLAYENKIWAVETDIHFTKDHVPIISHDPHLGRLFHKPHIVISEFTYQALRGHIPQILSLDEVVRTWGGKLHLMLEIKEDLKNRPADIAALQKTLAALKAIDDYHLLSLTPEFLEPLSFAPKSCYVDVIWLDAKSLLQKNLELGHGGVAGHFLFIGRKKLTELHAAHRQVGVGFLDSRNSLYREIGRKVDWIFTNHPLRLRHYLLD